MDDIKALHRNRALVFKEILKERGYEEVLLWCLEENKNARNFYEKVGGKLYKERLFKIGNIYYNEVSYKYNLKHPVINEK